MKKVNWYPWRPGDENHPLFIDSVYIEPKKYFDTEDFSSYEFYHCPAWNSWAKNTWVFYSQLDWNVELVDGQIHVHTDHQHFNELMGDIQIVNDEMIIQLDPLCLLWTKNKNIWLEQLSYPGLETVPGQFKLGNWTRTLSLAFRTKHLKIKRGDPIFMIRFSGDGQNYELSKTKPTQETIKTAEKNLGLKKYLPGKSWELSIKETKCPFSFLWT